MPNSVLKKEKLWILLYKLLYILIYKASYLRNPQTFQGQPIFKKGQIYFFGIKKAKTGNPVQPDSGSADQSVEKQDCQDMEAQGSLLGIRSLPSHIASRALYSIGANIGISNVGVAALKKINE